MDGAETSLCRTVTDIYREAVKDALDEVSRRLSGAMTTCGREAQQESTAQGRLTLFTRCLTERIRPRRGR